jgi:hypothetical protein
MVLSSEEYRTINELRADEYRNYLPFDLHNQKNNSNFALRNVKNILTAAPRLCRWSIITCDLGERKVRAA